MAHVINQTNSIMTGEMSRDEMAHELNITSDDIAKIKEIVTKYIQYPEFRTILIKTLDDFEPGKEEKPKNESKLKPKNKHTKKKKKEIHQLSKTTNNNLNNKDDDKLEKIDEEIKLEIDANIIEEKRINKELNIFFKELIFDEKQAEKAIENSCSFALLPTISPLKDDFIIRGNHDKKRVFKLIQIQEYFIQIGVPFKRWPYIISDYLIGEDLENNYQLLISEKLKTGELLEWKEIAEMFIKTTNLNKTNRQLWIKLVGNKPKPGQKVVEYLDKSLEILILTVNFKNRDKPIRNIILGHLERFFESKLNQDELIFEEKDISLFFIKLRELFQYDKFPLHSEKHK